jgi:hypothetical protein
MKVAMLFGLVLLGMIGHFVKKMSDLEAAGTVLSPITYVKDKPWRTTSAVMGGLMLAMAFHWAGQLNELAALLTGVGCSEAFDALRARAAGRLRESLPDTTDTGSGP